MKKNEQKELTELTDVLSEDTINDLNSINIYNTDQLKDFFSAEMGEIINNMSDRFDDDRIGEIILEVRKCMIKYKMKLKGGNK